MLLGICTYGLSAKVGTALHIIKKEVIGNEIKATKQLGARINSKVKQRINSLYYKYFQRAAKKAGLVKVARKLKNKVSALKFNKVLNSRVGEVITGELKASAVGKLISNFTKQLKHQDIVQTIEIFSSAGSFIAALIEVQADNNLNGDIGS